MYLKNQRIVREGPCLNACPCMAWCVGLDSTVASQDLAARVVGQNMASLGMKMDSPIGLLGKIYGHRV